MEHFVIALYFMLSAMVSYNNPLQIKCWAVRTWIVLFIYLGKWLTYTV